MSCTDHKSWHIGKLKSNESKRLRAEKLRYEYYLSPVCCVECATPIIYEFRKVKKYCNSSCAASYNNRNKHSGYRRSKLEKQLEAELPNEYPDLEFLFNNRSVIGYELDIYIPSLRLAIELNGPVHYGPVFSEEAYEIIKHRDQLKQQLCIDNNITLHVINVCERNVDFGAMCRTRIDNR